jgi:Domain of unknown function (DUF4365)
LTENEQKQQLSFAYIHALAARAGYTFQQTPVDDDSIDVRIGARGLIHGLAVLRSPIMELQLKATQGNGFVRENHVAFPLPVKNFNELRLPSMLPRLLVVFLLPADPSVWLETSEECMISRHCAYWASLRGMAETDNTSTVTVSLPRSQRLTVDGLRELMERVAGGERL